MPDDVCENPDGAAVSGSLTAAGEAARREIVRLYAVDAVARPVTKQDAFRHVRRALAAQGIRPSRRQLDLAWRAAAPPEAKRPGQRGKRG